MDYGAIYKDIKCKLQNEVFLREEVCSLDQ